MRILDESIHRSHDPLVRDGVRSLASLPRWGDSLILDSISVRLELPLALQGSSIHRLRRGHSVWTPTDSDILPIAASPSAYPPAFPAALCFWDDPSAPEHAVDTCSGSFLSESSGLVTPFLNSV